MRARMLCVALLSTVSINCAPTAPWAISEPGKPFVAFEPARDFQPPQIVLQYDPATKSGVNWAEVSNPKWHEATPEITIGRAANYLRDGLKRMTGKEFTVVSKNDLSRGIVLTLLKDAPADIRNDPEVRRALQADPKDQYSANEAFFLRSEKDRLLVVANTPDGLLDAAVELLESVDYEILGMGPDWIYAPDYRSRPLVFALKRSGRPSFYTRGIYPFSGQSYGVGTIMSGLTDPADESVNTSCWRWLIGARICGKSMPSQPGHALQGYHNEVIKRMRATGTTEGFLSPQTVIGLDAQRPPASAENNGWVWINNDAKEQPGANQVYTSDGKTWTAGLGWNLDLSVPFVRQIVFESMKEQAKSSFEKNPNDLLLFGMDAEDGAPGNAVLDRRMAHKNWYPEYLAKEGVPFGKPYVLNGYKGLNQPKEVWDPASASDNMFGLANYLLREFDKWVDSLPKDLQITSTGKSKKNLLRCTFYSYNYHDVPPNFNPDPRIRLQIAGYPKHRGQGKWEKFVTNEDIARAFKIMMPSEPMGDYRYYSYGWHDFGYGGIPAGWSASPAKIADDYQRTYDAGYRAIIGECDFNFARYGLGYYLMSKMLWNARLGVKDLDAIRDRWFQRAYGSVWKEIKAYYDFMLPANFPVNAPNTWAKAIRLIDAADKKLDGAKEPEVQRRIDDLKQFWYAHYLFDNGHSYISNPKSLPNTPEVREFLWKGQMSYMISMYPLVQWMFGEANATKVKEMVGPQISAGPAHYTHEETQKWWAKVLDFWKVTPVLSFSESTLANGKPTKSVDLNDLVMVKEYQSAIPDSAFANNTGSSPAVPFLTIARRKDEIIGFKHAWPKQNDYCPTRKFYYGADIWDPAKKKWDSWVDKTVTYQQVEEKPNAQGTPMLIVDVRLKAPRPGTYRFDLGRGGDMSGLGSLAWDPIAGKYVASVGFTFYTATGGLTQSPVYFYIPKGTKSLDLEVWDPHKYKFVQLYKGLPAQKPALSRKVDVSTMGTHTVALQPGEDGTVARFEGNGFAFPYLYSIPTLWAKSPSALLVPRDIAQADGLTVLKE